jgi:hypothetical protein
MTKAELVKFCENTCQSKNRKQTEGETEVWISVLSEYATADLDAALRRWHSDVTIEEFTQKPKGARMPTPAELKLSIDQFNQSAARTHSGQFVACGNCQDGWVKKFVGITSGGNPVNPKDGALQRCQCWSEYLAAFYGVSLSELPAFLKKKRQPQQSRRAGAGAAA